MNINRTLHRLALTVVVTVVAPLCFAAQAPLTLRYDSEVYTLAAFEMVTASYHYYGGYSSPYSLTGGTQLHLFPNRQFVIVETCDICRDLSLAWGKFEVKKDQLLLTFERIRPGSETLKKEFANLRLYWGWIEKPGYVTGHEVFIISTANVALLRKKSPDAEFIHRYVEYHDWVSLLRDYSKNMDEPKQ